MKGNFPNPYPLNLDQNLTLKPLSPDQTNDFFAFVQQNRNHLEQFDPFVAAFHTSTDVHNVLSKISRLRQEGQSLSCGIWMNNKIIGYFNCGLDHEKKAIQIGYGLASNHTGQGIITRTARAILNYAFQNYNMNYAWLTVWIDNASSIKVAERLGFKREDKVLPAKPERGILTEQYRYTLEKPTNFN